MTKCKFNSRYMITTCMRVYRFNIIYVYRSDVKIRRNKSLNENGKRAVDSYS